MTCVGRQARRHQRPKPPKFVHKLMFSMPPGTPPDKVLGAVRNFAREEFWGQHRYAFALHTDEDHPHVHLVLKAVSEQGVRLNIKKADAAPLAVRVCPESPAARRGGQRHRARRPWRDSKSQKGRHLSRKPAGRFDIRPCAGRSRRRRTAQREPPRRTRQTQTCGNTKGGRKRMASNG